MDIDAGPGSLAAPDWSYLSEAAIRTAPAVRNGVVYTASGKKSFSAINAITGEVQWSSRIGEQRTSSPAVTENAVYVGASNGRLYALQPATGFTLWWVGDEQDYFIYSSPTVADEIIYFRGKDRWLYALETTDGSKLWSTSYAKIRSSLTVIESMVYIGGHSHPSLVKPSSNIVLSDYAP